MNPNKNNYVIINNELYKIYAVLLKTIYCFWVSDKTLIKNEKVFNDYELTESGYRLEVMTARQAS